MPAVSDKQRRFMGLCSSDEGRKKAKKRCPAKEVAREFLRNSLYEEAPTNATGAAVSGTANPGDESTPKAPMLFQRRKKARNEIERSKMLRRHFSDLRAGAN